jgi:hypothetical protein
MANLADRVQRLRFWLLPLVGVIVYLAALLRAGQGDV